MWSQLWTLLQDQPRGGLHRADARGDLAVHAELPVRLLLHAFSQILTLCRINTFYTVRLPLPPTRADANDERD